MVHFALARPRSPFRFTLLLVSLRLEKRLGQETSGEAADASTEIEGKRIRGTVESIVFRSGRRSQRARGTEMIRASVEIVGNNSVFSIAVYAENLRRAVEFAANRYPGYAVSVRFPLDPEMFFAEGPAVGTETVEPVAMAVPQHEQRRSEVTETPAVRRRWVSTVGTTSGLSNRERAAS